MGQVFSYIWRCIRPKLTRENEKTLQDDQLHHLIDPFQHQGHHIITIPDAVTTQEVSGSIPPQVPLIAVDLNYTKNNEKDEEDYVEQVLTPVVEKEIVVKNTIFYNVHNNRASRDGHTSNMGQTSKFVGKVSTENGEMPIKRIGQYTSKQMILLVGEGDFSFSASLAVTFGSASNIIATSLNSQAFLIENYSMFRKNKMELESRGGTLIHDVDARTMILHSFLASLKFDRIIFNFPHAGKFTNTTSDLRKHKELVRGFLRNAKKMIREDGEIHITHKSNGFFLEWNIPKIGSDQGLRLIQEMMFRRSKYPGYCTKYGFGGDKDFECTPCKTYKFGLPQK